MGSPSTTFVPHVGKAHLKSHHGQHFSDTCLTSYEVFMITALHRTLSQGKGNPAALLPSVTDKVPHDCLTLTGLLLTPWDNMQESALGNTDSSWFSDGFFFKVTMTNTELGMILQLFLILLKQHLYLWLLWLNRLNYILLHGLLFKVPLTVDMVSEELIILECCRSNMASLHVCLVTQSCLTLCNPMDCSLPSSSDHGDSPGKNTGVGCHALLQGIFPT